MNSLIILLVALCVYIVEAKETEEVKNVIEARGKGKYALLTNLAILLAVKFGLYKIFLGIAFVIASMKLLVVMAWALAVAKHVPNAWPSYKSDHLPNKYEYFFDKIGHKPGYGAGGSFMDSIVNWFRRQVHFFYVAAAKLFILKIVYGILFYALLIKGWHFVLWFVSYIKKDKHVEYIEHEPIYGHHDHGYHDNYDHHGPHYEYHDNYDHRPYHGYEKTGKGILEYEPSNKNKVYDADGSYSVPLA